MVSPFWPSWPSLVSATFEDVWGHGQVGAADMSKGIGGDVLRNVGQARSECLDLRCRTTRAGQICEG